MARIRQVVDNAYACDPRLVLFKQQDQRKKMEIKEAKRMVQRQRQIEEENVSSYSHATASARPFTRF